VWLVAGVMRAAGGLDAERRRIDREQQRPEGECAQLVVLLVTSRLGDRPLAVAGKDAGRVQ
jgi:hypothetical protein